MSIDAGVQKTMTSVLNEINKANSLQNNSVSKIDILRKNVGKVFLVSIDEINISENIRSNINTESAEFLNLTESIKKYGVIQSIVVEFRDKRDGSYELVCVAGHRRLEAARKIGLEKISCLIQQFSNPSDRTGIALTENLNREGLHSLDIAEGYAELKALGWSEEEISKQFERDIRTIQRYLNVASWPEDVKKIIRENQQKFPHSIIMKKFALRRHISEDEKEKLRTEILRIAFGNIEKNESKDTNKAKICEISRSFSEKYGLKSELKDLGDNKGKFTVSFSSEEEKHKLFCLLEKLA